MEISIQAPSVCFSGQIQNRHLVDLPTRVLYSHKVSLPLKMRIEAQEVSARSSHKLFAGVSAIYPGLQDDKVSASPESVSANVVDSRELKIRVDVSGAKTQVIFDDVLDKLVAAAQPIPGFRRVKGGKTPDIPRDVLLHIIGPLKVNKQAIKKIINSSVAEIVEKEELRVTNNLKIEESYEELEAAFKPGKDFSFYAILQLQDTDSKRNWSA